MKFTPGIMAVSRGAAPVLWQPTDLGSDLKVWWNADDTTTGAVATWTSRVGSLAPTAAAGLQPASGPTSFNSAYRGVVFDGTDDCLVGTSFGSMPVGATAGEIWSVAEFTGGAALAVGRPTLKYGSGAGTATNRALQRNTVSSVNRYTVTDGLTLLQDTVVALTLPFIGCAWWSGTTQGGRLNGQDMTPATGTIPTLNTTATRYRIGAQNAASALGFWLGPIRHIMVTLLLSSTNREKMEGWCAWDSGLTGTLVAGHPYKSAPPYV